MVWSSSVLWGGGIPTPCFNSKPSIKIQLHWPYSHATLVQVNLHFSRTAFISSFPNCFKSQGLYWGLIWNKRSRAAQLCVCVCARITMGQVKEWSFIYLKQVSYEWGKINTMKNNQRDGLLGVKKGEVHKRAEAVAAEWVTLWSGADYLRNTFRLS